MHPLHSAVEQLMRQAGEAIVMPRFRALAGHEVQEKSPGEVVTIVDRECEAFLTDNLLPLLPGSDILAEEAHAADPNGCADPGRGAVWIVDPLDGTSNFAEGHGSFAIMIALTIDGTAEAGWMLDPQSGRFCSAARGKGAWIDGRPVRSNGSRTRLPRAAIATQFLARERRDEVMRRSRGKFELVPIPRCAGEEYCRLVLGQNDIALFERTLPWDHVPGCVFVNEAGGVAARPDGSEYRADKPGAGLIAAATPVLWEQAKGVLFDD